MENAAVGQLFLHGLYSLNGCLISSLNNILSFGITLDTIVSQDHQMILQPTWSIYLKFDLQIDDGKKADQVFIQGEMWTVSNFIGSCHERILSNFVHLLSRIILNNIRTTSALVIHFVVLECMEDRLWLLQWYNVGICSRWMPTYEPWWKSKGIKFGPNWGPKYFQFYQAWHSLDVSLTPLNSISFSGTCFNQANATSLILHTSMNNDDKASEQLWWHN